MRARAVFYARYSSDNQRQASIEDQSRRCRALIERKGWIETDVFTDYAISGAISQRPGFMALLDAVRAGRVDVVVAEALDRISRDLEHIARFFKEATHAGVRIITLAEGDISDLHIGVKGTMNAVYLKDLAQKTHRGLEGRIKAGKSAGGLSFGYRVVREVTANGTLNTGDLAIDEDQAAIVRRVFTLYVAGMSPRSIARTLQQEGIRGPRGGHWTASLILGNAARETGILRNRLYIGQLVWNRQRFSKDPKTGKRVARLNPRDQWMVEPVPSLRIIDDHLWEAAQARLQLMRSAVLPATAPSEDSTPTVPSSTGTRLGRARRPAWPLAGLVKCGVCDGPLTVMGKDRLGCANHHARSICSNNRTILRHRLQAKIFAGLKQRLLAPDLVARFVETYVQEVNAANQERGARRAKLQVEQARLSRQIKTVLNTIKDIGGSRSLVEELRALEGRQDDIAADLAREAQPEQLIELHPNLPDLYRRRVEALEAALQEPEGAAAAAQALRSLIDAVMFYPESGRGQYRLELRGDLAAFLYLEAETAKARANSGTGLVCSDVRSSLVAGARNHRELTTLQTSC
jgi:site-specific DNA recombinase